MDRRVLMASGLSLIAVATTSKALAQGAPPVPSPDHDPTYRAEPLADTYSRDELVNKASDFFGVGASTHGSVWPDGGWHDATERSAAAPDAAALLFRPRGRLT